MPARYGPEAAVRAINERLAQIASLYQQCEAIAIEHDVQFSYEGPAGYGDGGYFYPEAEERWGEVLHWIASSTSC
jgi:hypothetical protein